MWNRMNPWSQWTLITMIAYENAIAASNARQNPRQNSIQDKIQSETKLCLRKRFFVGKNFVGIQNCPKNICLRHCLRFPVRKSEMSPTNRCLSSLIGMYIPQQGVKSMLNIFVDKRFNMLLANTVMSYLFMYPCGNTWKTFHPSSNRQDCPLAPSIMAIFSQPPIRTWYRF